MADFFKQAPASESLQKRFFESIFHKQSVVGSFPLVTPILPLYSFPAMMLSGMALALCTDAFAVRRNLAALRQAGYEAPAVQGMDGDTPPHQQRAIFEDINHHRIHLLFLTPDQFCSFRFLPTLAHAPISFLAIEDAHELLPNYGPSRRYDKALETLASLRRRPPLALLASPLSHARREALVRLTAMSSSETFLALEETPVLGKTRLRVCCALTENQKFETLRRTLSGASEKDSVGGLFRAGSVVIRAHDAQSAEALLQRLHRVGFEPLYAYSPERRASDRQGVADAFARQRNAIVVAHGPGDRHLIPPPDVASKLIYWQLPTHLEETFGQLFPAAGSEDRATEALILYTRDDYQQALERAQFRQQRASIPRRVEDGSVKTLARSRQWLTSNACRVRTLTQLVKPDMAQDLQDCGLCDACASPAGGGFLRRALRHWLY